MLVERRQIEVAQVREDRAHGLPGLAVGGQRAMRMPGGSRSAHQLGAGVAARAEDGDAPPARSALLRSGRPVCGKAGPINPPSRRLAAEL